MCVRFEVENLFGYPEGSWHDGSYSPRFMVLL